jgi:hypothetical protein
MTHYEDALKRLLAERLHSNIDNSMRQVVGEARSDSSQALPIQLATPKAGGSSSEETISAPNLSRLGLQIEQLAKLVERPTVVPPSSTTATKSSSSGEAADNSIVRTALRTAGMMTGVGPLVAGLIGLFGGSKEDAAPVLQPFALPSSIAVDAGIDRDGTVTPINYSQAGLARSSAVREPQPATIQINVQAMDSRSFLDHSDDIARAVREAMLHSHGLNDVVAEL